MYTSSLTYRTPLSSVQAIDTSPSNSSWSNIESLEDIYPFAGKLVVIKNFHTFDKKTIESMYDDCGFYADSHDMNAQYSPWMWRSSQTTDPKHFVALVKPVVYKPSYNPLEGNTPANMTLQLLPLKRECLNVPYPCRSAEKPQCTKFIQTQKIDTTLIQAMNQHRETLQMRPLSQLELGELKEACLSDEIATNESWSLSVIDPQLVDTILNKGRISSFPFTKGKDCQGYSRAYSPWSQGGVRHDIVILKCAGKYTMA